MSEYLETDVLIIGNGIAGSTAALQLAESGIDTVVITKGDNFSHTNTYLAQGGIASLGKDEEPGVFVGDILKSGDNVNNREAVEFLVKNSRHLVENILIGKLDVPFSLKNGSFDLAREGAHSHRRVLNVKDMTGRLIQEKLSAYLDKFDNLRLLYNHQAIDLLTFPHHSSNPMRIFYEPRTVGAYVLDKQSQKVKRIFARKVILASGGLSSIFINSTNPPDVVGNGVAMASRAGARLACLEYVQFHPTSLYHKEAGGFLISEAVRGEGAKLMNRKGE